MHMSACSRAYMHASLHAGADALHRAERNEFLVDAKLRQGGPLQIPVREWCVRGVGLGRVAVDGLVAAGWPTADTRQGVVR